MKYKYIIAENMDPYYNLAKEQLLMKYAVDGVAILFLWQNENTIVIGRNQSAEKECRLKEFLLCGGRIARRRSGGGAVFHDIGNLNFSIMCGGKDIEECSYQELVKKALLDYGIEAKYNGRNDLMSDGRKFSGNATYSEKGILCQHGTLLISTDIEKMTYFLTPEQSKLQRNYVCSVESRVVNLHELSDGISVNSMKQSMISAVKATAFEGGPDIEEINQLVQFYASDKWIYGGKR